LTTKLFIFLAVSIFIFSSFLTTQAQTGNSIWRDDMTYQNLGQLQAAGWTITHEDGVSFSGSAIVLDGTSEDTAIHYSNLFPSGISNWKVEDKSRWTLGSHCGNIVTAVTNKHSYSFAADGWYGNFVFYRDGQKTTFGSFKESKNAWFTLAIEKQGNQINMYYNGEIKSTYTETDASASQLIGADAVSPWRGGSEYDYFEVWQIGDTSTQEAQESLLSNPIVIGGIIGAVCVGVGGVLYFFVFSGGGAASSSGGAAGAGGSGGGSVIQDHPISPLSGEAPVSPLSGESTYYGSEDLHSNYYDSNASGYDQYQEGTYDSSPYNLEDLYSNPYENYALDPLGTYDSSTYNLQDNSSVPVPESDAYYDNYSSGYDQYPAGTYDPAPYEMNQYLDPASNNYYDPNQPGTYDPSPYETNDVYTDPYENANYAVDQYPPGTYDTSIYEQAQQQASYSTQP
jgi:hypothetical protein